jgi:hypothetical protein
MSTQQKTTKEIWATPTKRSQSNTIWDKLCVDLIGPYKIRKKGKDKLICKCVTMIDPATGWFEIQQYHDKQSVTVANIVEQEPFSMYPWPTKVTFDRGSKFIGQDFQNMIKEDYGVKAKPITVRNTVRLFELESKYFDEEDPWKGILSATAFAVRSTFHTTLRNTPGQLVLGRDMIFNIKHEANWEFICNRKQQLIEKNNEAENAKRIPHTYNIGDKVQIRRGTENKYEAPCEGP